MSELIPIEEIASRIYLIRGKKVMLSFHLAELYGVETRVLIQAVKRNIERFPEDFMFQLTDEEWRYLKSQIVISSWGGIRRANPYAFTEQGVAMLSSVLKSKKAIKVNIAIMRAFVKLREYLHLHRELVKKIEEHDKQIKTLFEIINKFLLPAPKTKKRIGF
ncbi:MAG: ORF6N domain-containing protein [Caldiserica bacterium]|nr:MAG: ORF6N domain-containing protein [Caldisericota bacterium]